MMTTTPYSVEIVGPSAPLVGRINPPGSKNACLPLLVAASLVGHPVTLRNVPALADVSVLLEILHHLGCEVQGTSGEVMIRGPASCGLSVPGTLSVRLRGALYSLALPACLMGRAYIGAIGGDVLSGRTLAPHVRAFAGFGMQMSVRGEGYEISGGPPRPGDFVLDDNGNTATGISVLLASRCEGRSVIRGASLEPENDDLLDFLRRFGVASERDGRTIIVEGALRAGPIYEVPFDRIYCGTMAMAALITGGEIEMPGALVAPLRGVLETLEACGAVIDVGTHLRVGGCVRRPLHVHTSMFPGFPTDLLPQLSAMLTRANGVSTLREGVYRARFDHVAALRELGAAITIDGDRAQITGPRHLAGARLRGGVGIRETAALVLAGLAAHGTTVIEDAAALRRGYENLPADLARLGALMR